MWRPFSQLAYLSLPAHVSESVYYRRELKTEVKALLKELPEETLKIVDLIPGLEEVREILQLMDVQPKFKPEDGSGVRTGASILRVSVDYDYYQEQGHENSLIVRTLESRAETYDPIIVKALGDHLSISQNNYTLEEISTRDLKEGMRLKDDLLLQEQLLIASGGADIDRQLLKVVRNYISCYSEFPFPKKIKVLIPVS